MPYYAALFLWSLLCLILQSTLFPQLMVAGVKPDLLLILLIFNCFFQGPWRGSLVGFALGFLEDLYLGSYVGLNALTKAITVFICGWFLRGAFREKLLVPIFALFFGSLIHGLLMILGGHIIGLPWTWGLFYWKVLPAAIYNACLVPFLYASYYHWVQKDLEQQSI